MIVLLLAAIGYGAYLVGKPGADTEALRASAAKGREAGAETGTKLGYERGFEVARKRAHPAAYAAAYREAYTDEFEQADLVPPQRIEAPEPR